MIKYKSKDMIWLRLNNIIFEKVGRILIYTKESPTEFIKWKS